MEGNYLFEQWCRKKGYPASYVELQKESSIADIEELDKKWDVILAEYDESNRIPRKTGGVITPQSFGGHLKKE